MTDLPRYSLDDDRDMDLTVWLKHPLGDWVKWGDVSARLQQLERELASAKTGCTMQTVVAPDGSPVAAPCAISGCEYGTFEARLLEVEDASTGVFVALKSRAETALAALAETRDALHQLVWEVSHHGIIAARDRPERPPRSTVSPYDRTRGGN